jgi:surface protein
MFCACTSLITVPGIGNWDFGSVDYAISMFNGCSNLQYLDNLSGWDMRKVYDFGYMFYGCKNLTALEGIGAWKFESLEKAMCLFMECYSLTELDIADWNMSKVQTFTCLFASNHQNKGDMKLKSLDLSKWDTSSATNMSSMFYGCGQLTELDLSGWNMPNLTKVSHMFADCFKLEKIDLSGWQTPALTCLDAMFNDCRVLKTVDMSSFDTSNVREFSQIFESCYALESIVGLENWNTDQGQDFSETFSGCGSLKELNISTFNTSNADYKYLSSGQYENWVLLRFMSSCNSLEKVTFGPNFSFDGIGNCPNGYKFVMPSATKVAGWDGKWYTADGTGYLPSAIPEMTAATYYAVNPLKPVTPPADSANP